MSALSSDVHLLGRTLGSSTRAAPDQFQLTRQRVHPAHHIETLLNRQCLHTAQHIETHPSQHVQNITCQHVHSQHVQNIT